MRKKIGTSILLLALCLSGLLLTQGCSKNDNSTNSNTSNSNANAANKK